MELHTEKYGGHTVNDTIRSGVEATLRKVSFDLEADLLTSQLWESGYIRGISMVIDSNIERLQEAKEALNS